MSASPDSWKTGRLPCATAALLLLAHPLSAQLPAVNVTARFGIAIPVGAYERNCEGETGTFSLEVSGRRRVFPQLTVDKFSGTGGAMVGCDPGQTTVGGLRLDGATRVGLGGGVGIGGRWVGIEGAVLGAFITGRRGFPASPSDVERVVLPQVGGQATIILFRYAVLTDAYHRTRLTRETATVTGSVETRRTWSLIYTWQFGVRVPLGPAS